MTGERIVVGIDGSTGSRRALDWAIAHAGPDDRIDVIHTWHAPPGAMDVGISIDPTIFEDSAKAVLKDELDVVRAEHEDAVDLTGHLVRGHPGLALIDAAADADLLVVGTRGRGGFVGLLLGSTSTYLAHHVSCPLVIVPSDDDS